MKHYYSQNFGPKQYASPPGLASGNALGFGSSSNLIGSKYRIRQEYVMLSIVEYLVITSNVGHVDLLKNIVIGPTNWT